MSAQDRRVDQLLRDLRNAPIAWGRAERDLADSLLPSHSTPRLVEGYPEAPPGTDRRLLIDGRLIKRQGAVPKSPGKPESRPPAGGAQDVTRALHRASASLAEGHDRLALTVGVGAGFTPRGVWPGVGRLTPTNGGEWHWHDDSERMHLGGERAAQVAAQVANMLRKLETTYVEQEDIEPALLALEGWKRGNRKRHGFASALASVWCWTNPANRVQPTAARCSNDQCSVQDGRVLSDADVNAGRRKCSACVKRDQRARQKVAA